MFRQQNAIISFQRRGLGGVAALKPKHPEAGAGRACPTYPAFLASYTPEGAASTARIHGGLSAATRAYTGQLSRWAPGR